MSAGAVFQFWALSTPAKWQAGSVGVERTPIYFACADCRTPEAVIAGIISTDGTYLGVGVLGDLDRCNLRPAMFCGPCYANRLASAGRTPGAEPEVRE